jgi:hypothetical protein
MRSASLLWLLASGGLMTAMRWDASSSRLLLQNAGDDQCLPEYYFCGSCAPSAMSLGRLNPNATHDTRSSFVAFGIGALTVPAFSKTRRLANEAIH